MPLMPQTHLYLDFDDTLYNSHSLNAEVMDYIVARTGYSLETVQMAYERSRSGGTSLQKHLAELKVTDALHDDIIAFRSRRVAEGNRYLFPDVLDACKALSKKATLHLLSFGQSQTQFEKWHGVSTLHPLFTSVHVVSHEGKGSFFTTHKDLLAREHVLFVDDKISQLEDVATNAPFVELFQILRFPHRQLQDRFTVIHTLNELLNVLD